MQITIFGASGRVGQLVTLLALERGHQVRAFVHSRDPFEADANLQVINGDVSNDAHIAQAIQGSEAVISTLGSWGTKDKNVLETGMKTIIPAMQTHGITRIVTLTGTGALWSHDKPKLTDKSGRLVLGLIAPKILRDGEAHIRLLEASSLNWTCIRSPVINDRGSSDYTLDLRLSSVFANVSRQSVATSLLDMIESNGFIKQAPVIHRV